MAAVDDFSTFGDSPSMPSRKPAPVTPHNTNELPFVTKGLYVGGAGDLKVTTMNGDDVTFSSVAAGTLLPIRVKRVFNTGTTATLIIALN